MTQLTILNSGITAIGFWALVFPSTPPCTGSSKASPQRLFKPTVFLRLRSIKFTAPSLTT